MEGRCMGKLTLNTLLPSPFLLIPFRAFNLASSREYDNEETQYFPSYMARKELMYTASIPSSF